MPRTMIDLDEAYGILFAHIRPGPTVGLPLAEALHRTLAVPVCCDVDSPPFDRSSMDGYAVRAADVAGAPVTLPVVAQIAAGSTADRALGPGEAMQINTGAPMPPGADAVVQVELTEPAAGGSEVLIRKSVPPGRFITPRATDASAGQTVLEAGVLLTPLEIGSAASAGAARVTVYRRPVVAALATGDELVDIDRKPTGGQIRNTNQYLLEGLIRSAHAEPVSLGVAPDEPEKLRERITEGLRRSDVLCLTGGVSMGAFDFVPEALEACGVTFHFQKMAIKPGRPVIFGAASDGTLAFGLPGNPVSAFVGFELLVRPALAALEGRSGVVPQLVRATLRGSVKPTADRRSYTPARAWVEKDGQWTVEPLSWHGSGDLFGAATANALVVRPPRSQGATTGEVVSMILLDRI